MQRGKLYTCVDTEQPKLWISLAQWQIDDDDDDDDKDDDVDDDDIDDDVQC